MRTSSTIHVAIAAGLLAGGALLGCQRRVAAPPPAARYEVIEGDPVPDHLKGTVLEQVVVYGTVPQVISGYGLVVNLDNTGRDDGIPTPIRDRLAETAGRRGLSSPSTDGQLGQLSPLALLADPRTAIVRVEGFVPPAARAGQRIDVVVRALDGNTTPSLARGFLWLSELYEGSVGPANPGEAVNKVGVARGPLMLNPVHALLGPEESSADPAAIASLRTGVVPDGGVVEFERPITLRLRQPSYRTARLIESRINFAFGRDIANARDEATVELRMPQEGDYAPRSNEDWENFLGVALHLYLRSDGVFASQQSSKLREVAETSSGDDETLLGISQAWQAIGQEALPAIAEAAGSDDDSVAFYAARTAAQLKQPWGYDRLASIAGSPTNPYNVAAAEALGEVPTSAAVRRVTRDLLWASNAGNDAVRLAAYESLLRLGFDQTGVQERAISDNFVLHLTPGDGTPLVYATRTGRPTIAILGALQATGDEVPRLREPMLLSLFGDRLTITRTEKSPVVRLFQRDLRPENADAAPDAYADVRSLPDLRELVTRLGGERVAGERAIDLNYGDVVAVLKKLGDDRDLVAGPLGEQIVSVRLQEPRSYGGVNAVEDAAPLVPGLERRRLEQLEQAGEASAQAQ